MSENTLATTNNATDAATQDSENQAQPVSKSYTQQEVDNMMARMKGSLEKKLLKPYEDLGDVNELRSIKTEWEQKQQELQVKRGEFENILKEKATKFEAEISKRDSIIKEYKVNVPILSAAAKYNAVNAEQVKALLSTNVRLNESGDVEVVDAKGSVRYKDNGESLQVEDLVKEFLDTNPHFKLANPTTTNTRSNIGNKAQTPLDITKLDMSRAEDRAVYREYKKANGLIN
jgi:hypothetical protein